MRITRQQLSEMIDSEVADALLRVENRRLTESRVASSFEGVKFVDAYALVQFAKAYASLGAAVQEQLDDVLDDVTASVNPNAVNVVKQRLGGMNDELDGLIEEWEKSYYGEE